MGWSMVGIIEDPLEGKLLVAGGETRKGGAFIARITGVDPKFRYAREFLGVRDYRFPGIPKGCVIVKVPTAQLREGDLLEIRSGGSWKKEYRGFYLYQSGTIQRIGEEELRRRLAERLASSPTHRSG